MFSFSPKLKAASSLSFLFLFLISFAYATDVLVQFDDETIIKNCVKIGLNIPFTFINPYDANGYDVFCSYEGTATNAKLLNDSTYAKTFSNTNAANNGFAFTLIKMNSSMTYNSDTSLFNLNIDLDPSNPYAMVVLLDENNTCVWCYYYGDGSSSDCDGLGNTPCNIVSTRIGSDEATTSMSKLEVNPAWNGSFSFVGIGGAGAGADISVIFDNVNLTTLTIVTIPPLGNISSITDRTRTYTDFSNDGPNYFNNAFYVIIFIFFLWLLISLRTADLSLILAGFTGLVASYILTGDFTQMITSITMLGLGITILLVRGFSNG